MYWFASSEYRYNYAQNILNFSVIRLCLIMRFYVPLTMISVAINPVILNVITNLQMLKSLKPLYLLVFLLLIFSYSYYFFSMTSLTFLFAVCIVYQRLSYFIDGVICSHSLFVNVFLFTKKFFLKLIPSVCAIIFYIVCTWLGFVDNVSDALITFFMYLIATFCCVSLLYQKIW